MSTVVIKGKTIIQGTTVMGSQAVGVVTSGQVLYYDFGNGSCYSGSGTTVNDLSGNANGATLTGSPTLTYSSTTGGIMTYPTTNTTGYFTTAAATTINDLTALTVNLWINPTTIVANPFFYKSDNNSVQGWFCGMETNIPTAVNGICFSKVLSTTNLRYAVDMSSMTAATWAMVTITFDGVAPAVTAPNVHIYLNTVELTTVTKTANGTGTYSSDAAQPLYCGRCDASTTTGADLGDFNGSQGVTQLYNRVLTTGEISQNFNAVRARYGL